MTISRGFRGIRDFEGLRVRLRVFQGCLRFQMVSVGFQGIFRGSQGCFVGSEEEAFRVVAESLRRIQKSFREILGDRGVSWSLIFVSGVSQEDQHCCS